MITRSPDGRAAACLTELGGKVFEVPVANRKDRFLATHSLIATVTTLLLAFDTITEEPFGEELKGKFENSIRKELRKTTEMSIVLQLQA